MCLYLALPPAQWIMGKQMLAHSTTSEVIVEAASHADLDFVMPVYNEGKNIVVLSTGIIATFL